jgi:transposase
MNYETAERTNSVRCGAYRADQWAARKQVADDLSVGMSTLNKWIGTPRHRRCIEEDLGLAKENDRLRRENRILRRSGTSLKNHSSSWV